MCDRVCVCGGGVRYIRTLEKKMHSIIVVVVRLVFQ